MCSSQNCPVYIVLQNKRRTTNESSWYSRLETGQLTSDSNLYHVIIDPHLILRLLLSAARTHCENAPLLVVLLATTTTEQTNLSLFAHRRKEGCSDCNPSQYSYIVLQCYYYYNTTAMLLQPVVGDGSTSRSE